MSTRNKRSEIEISCVSEINVFGEENDTFVDKIFFLVYLLQSTVGQNVLHVRRQVSTFLQETVTLGHQLPARTATLELPRPVYYIRYKGWSFP